MFSFQIICGKNFSTYWPLHTVELNQTSTFKLIRIFYLFSFKNSFLAKNQNFKFQFQPLLTENGRDKNLTCLIKFDKKERANDKNVRHAWA